MHPIKSWTHTHVWFTNPPPCTPSFCFHCPFPGLSSTYIYTCRCWNCCFVPVEQPWLPRRDKWSTGWRWYSHVSPTRPSLVWWKRYVLYYTTEPQPSTGDTQNQICIYFWESFMFSVRTECKQHWVGRKAIYFPRY